MRWHDIAHLAVRCTFLIFIPLLIFFDLVLFFGAGQKVSCLSCELSDYLKSSSLTSIAVQEAWMALRRFV